MEQQVEMKKLKICVIGAGAAGLCAARHLAADPSKFEFIVFEKSNDVGGTWVYTDKTGNDVLGQPIHSSMYKNLKTNLPKEIMNFPDYTEIKGDKSCVSHGSILEYLKNYAQHFKLHQFIQFNTRVENVKLQTQKLKNCSEKWDVKVKCLKSSVITESTYDAVIICNGHYFDPYIPNIVGLKDFTGQILHSHSYRKPEDFRDKTVILLGASSSGTDIALELTNIASRVYLSHNRDRLTRDVPLGFTEVQGIDRFENGKFILKDDSSVIADVLIFCTGYLFSYPFLDDNCGINVDENYVTSLYKHLINIEHPTMSIMGVPMVVIPFPMFHMQIQYILSILTGKIKLPPKLKMLEDSKLKNLNKRHAHVLSSAQWEYNNNLAKTGRFEPLPEYYRLGYQAWHGLRRTNLHDYKKFNLLIARDERNVEVSAS